MQTEIPEWAYEAAVAWTCAGPDFEVYHSESEGCLFVAANIAFWVKVEADLPKLLKFKPFVDHMKANAEVEAE